MPIGLKNWSSCNIKEIRAKPLLSSSEHFWIIFIVFSFQEKYEKEKVWHDKNKNEGIAERRTIPCQSQALYGSFTCLNSTMPSDQRTCTRCLHPEKNWWNERWDKRQFTAKDNWGLCRFSVIWFHKGHYQ